MQQEMMKDARAEAETIYNLISCHDFQARNRVGYSTVKKNTSRALKLGKEDVDVARKELPKGKIGSRFAGENERQPSIVCVILLTQRKQDVRKPLFSLPLLG